MNGIECKIYSVHCSVYSVYCSVHSVQGAHKEYLNTDGSTDDSTVYTICFNMNTSQKIRDIVIHENKL